MQVSEAGLDALFDLASHSPTARAPPAPLPQAAAALLRAERLEALRREAYETVTLPRDVSGLLKELRTHLQSKTEPPVYVSGARRCGRAPAAHAHRCVAADVNSSPAPDRRLLKAVALLRVSAYTCGRRCVDESDALLLEHVLWHRPEDAQRIRDFVLQWISRRITLSPLQVSVLADGLSQRAARPDRGALACKSMAAEAAKLRRVRMTHAAAQRRRRHMQACGAALTARAAVVCPIWHAGAPG